MFRNIISALLSKAFAEVGGNTSSTGRKSSTSGNTESTGRKNTPFVRSTKGGK